VALISTYISTHAVWVAARRTSLGFADRSPSTIGAAPASCHHLDSLGSCIQLCLAALWCCTLEARLGRPTNEQCGAQPTLPAPTDVCGLCEYSFAHAASSRTTRGWNTGAERGGATSLEVLVVVTVYVLLLAALPSPRGAESAVRTPEKPGGRLGCFGFVRFRLHKNERIPVA